MVYLYKLVQLHSAVLETIFDFCESKTRTIKNFDNQIFENRLTILTVTDTRITVEVSVRSKLVEVLISSTNLMKQSDILNMIMHKTCRQLQ